MDGSIFAVMAKFRLLWIAAASFLLATIIAVLNRQNILACAFLVIAVPLAVAAYIARPKPPPGGNRGF